MGFGRRFVSLFAVCLVAAWIAPAARAGNGVNGPVFIVVSLNGGSFASADFHCKCKGCVGKDGYTCHDNRCGCRKPKTGGNPKCCEHNCSLPSGSPIIVIPIGQFLAGYAVDDTRFSQGTDDLKAIVDALNAVGDFTGVQYTILGAIDTSGPNSIHLLTEDEGPVGEPVQDACFESGPMLATTILETNDAPTTTVELADYIQVNQDDPDAGAGIQEIYDDLFVQPADSTLTTETTTTSDGTTVLASVDAAGELFPHHPGDAVMSFEMSVDGNGSFTMKTSMPNMEIDVKPGSDTNPINVGSNGVIPIAILSTVAKDADGNTIYDSVTGLPKVKFDAPSWVDPSTATVFGVYAVQWAVEDVNGDYVDDLILHFDTQDLVAAGLDEDTTELEMLAEGYENAQGIRVGSFKDADAVDAF